MPAREQGGAQDVLAHGRNSEASAPKDVLTTMARATERIGLVATSSTTLNEPFTIARQFMVSYYQFELYRRLTQSSDATIAAISAKAVKEVDYHRDHVRTQVPYALLTLVAVLAACTQTSGVPFLYGAKVFSSSSRSELGYPYHGQRSPPSIPRSGPRSSRRRGDSSTGRCSPPSRRASMESAETSSAERKSGTAATG